MTIYSKITNKFFVRNNLKKAEKVEDLRVIERITEVDQETIDVSYIKQNKEEIEKGTDEILDHVNYKREQSAQRQLDKLLEVLYKLTRELDEDLNKLENKTIVQVELEQADSQPTKSLEIDSKIEKSEELDKQIDSIEESRKAEEANFNFEPVRTCLKSFEE